MSAKSPITPLRGTPRATRAAATLLVWALATSQAQGATVQLSGALPFSQAELEAALSARRVRLQQPLVVSPAGSAEVLLRYGPHTQRLGVERLGKEAQLRRISLLLAALTEGDLMVPLPPLPPPPAPKPAAPSDDDTLRVGVNGTAGMSPDGPKALLGGGLDVSLRIHGRLRAVVGAELLHRPSESNIRGELSSFQLPLRVGAAWAFRRVDLEARLLLGIAPLWVRGSGEERSLHHTSWLPSLGVALFYAMDIGGSIALRVGLVAELRLRRQELRLRGVTTHETSRLTLLSSFGLRWAS